MMETLYEIKDLITNRLREVYGLKYVSFDATMALAGYFMAKDATYDHIIEFIDQVVLEAAEGRDPVTGLGVFSSPQDKDYDIAQKMVEALV
jgi:hypothetical protein